MGSSLQLLFQSKAQHSLRLYFNVADHLHDMVEHLYNNLRKNHTVTMPNDNTLSEHQIEVQSGAVAEYCVIRPAKPLEYKEHPRRSRERIVFEILQNLYNDGDVRAGVAQFFENILLIPSIRDEKREEADANHEGDFREQAKENPDKSRKIVVAERNVAKYKLDDKRKCSSS